MKLIYQVLFFLCSFFSVILPIDQTVSNISFEYKILNKKECKQYFKTKKILKKGYQPIQITVTNNSDDYIMFSQKGLNVPTVDVDTVFTALHKNGIIRGLSLGLVGMLAASPLPMLTLLPWAVHVISCIGFTIFSAAGIFAGAGALMYNNKIAVISDFILQDQIIQPHSVVMGIVFVKVDKLTSDLSLIVQNQNSQELISL
ncbi:MAG: hypothetical protein ACXWL5_00745 [Candidatus Chromulinivorax sp.]